MVEMQLGASNHVQVEKMAQPLTVVNKRTATAIIQIMKMWQAQ